MRLELANHRRRAVINNNTLQCYHNTGKIRTTWQSIWPPIEGDTKELKRWAKAWLDKCRLPGVLQ